jgi:DNA-binding beta-propeller fold protein YncE
MSEHHLPSRIATMLSLVAALFFAHQAIADDIYVADHGSSTIKKVSSNGSIQVVASGIVGISGIALDAQGDIYATTTRWDAYSQLIKIAPDGTSSVIASQADSYWTDVAVDPTDNRVFVTEGPRGTLEQILPDGTIISKMELPDPHTLAIDNLHNVYVESVGSGGFCQLQPNGVWNLFPTPINEQTAFTCDNAGHVFVSKGNEIDESSVGYDWSTIATLSFTPAALAMDSAGNLYASDYYDSTISKIAPDGTVTPFASGLDLPLYMAVGVPEPGSVASFIFGIPALLPRRRGSNLFS